MLKTKLNYKNVRYTLKIITLFICSLIVLSGTLGIINYSNNTDQIFEHPDSNENTNLQLTNSHIVESKDSFIRTSRGSRKSKEDGDYEPNDLMKDAVMINVNKSATPKTIFGNLSFFDLVDWFKFNASCGLGSGKNATLFSIDLFDVSTMVGVYMELYAPKPYPHKLGNSTTHTLMNPNPANFNMVAPLNGTYYFRILRAGPMSSIGAGYKFVITVFDWNNTQYDGDNNFTDTNINIVNTTKDIQLIHNLSSIFDVHDFFCFTGYRHQNLTVDLLPQSNDADYDLFFFESQTTKYLLSSETIGKGSVNGAEKISTVLFSDRTYYIRVLARINNTPDTDNVKNFGPYIIKFSGNIPPRWRQNAPDDYYMVEDDPPLYMEPEDIWHDLNVVDDLNYHLWNSTSKDWEPRDNSSKVISSVDFETFSIELINNGSLLNPDEVIKITPFNNKFGDEEVKLGVSDSPADTFASHTITVHVLPENDAPIINNTETWEEFTNNGTIENNLISIEEFQELQIKVDAYDIEGDELTYSAEFEDPNTDFAKAFKIDTESGLISFFADHSYIGAHEIDINVTDDGNDPTNATTKKHMVFQIIPSTIDRIPKTLLEMPLNGSTLKIKNPVLRWNISDIDTDPALITYDIYLSTKLSEVLSHANEALIASGITGTHYEQKIALDDNTTYYWTVIPFDGVFTGICENDWYTLHINTTIIVPKVILKSPANNIIINYTNIKLQWKLIYSEDNKVAFDVYMGISEDVKELIFQETVETLNFEPSLISYGHTYYWGILPKAFEDNSILQGSFSEIWSFQIKRDYKPPVINLVEPKDKVILKNNDITFKWDVEYKEPESLDYEILVSSSSDFSNELLMNRTLKRFHTFFDLKVDTYYWKVVPFLNEIPGPESEVRSFIIDLTMVQPIVVPKFPLNNSTINVTTVELQWSLLYSGDISDIKYDVYLDSSTNDRNRMNQISSNHAKSYLPLVLNDKETYYWYVLPRIETENGIIIGEFHENISLFRIDSGYQEPPEPGFDLRLEPAYIQLPEGNQINVNLILNNTGNVDLSLSLSYQTEPNDILFLNLKIRKIGVFTGTNQSVVLEISAPPGVKPGTKITITVTAVADGTGLVDDEILAVEIISKDRDSSPNNTDTNSVWIYIICIVIVLVISILLLFIYLAKRKQKANLKEIGEEINQDRIEVQSTSPYTEPMPSVNGYKPITESYIQTIAQSSTPELTRSNGSINESGNTEPEKLETTTNGTPLVAPTVNSKPIQPVKPITPVTPIAPVTPVSAISIQTKAITPVIATPSQDTDDNKLSSAIAKPINSDNEHDI
jgi:hypothetical protein